MKQAQSAPLSVGDQVATIYTGTNGYLDDLAPTQVRAFLVAFRSYLATSKPKYAQILAGNVLLQKLKRL